MQVKMATKPGEGVAARVVLRFRPEDMQQVKAAAGDAPVAVFIRRALAQHISSQHANSQEMAEAA